MTCARRRVVVPGRVPVFDPLEVNAAALHKRRPQQRWNAEGRLKCRLNVSVPNQRAFKIHGPKSALDHADRGVRVYVCVCV